MKDEGTLARIQDWLEGRLDQEAEQAFLAEQEQDPELAEECRLMQELQASLASLDEDLIPKASFHETVMAKVREDAAAAAKENAGPQRPVSLGKNNKKETGSWFERLRMGTVLPVAACLLAAVLVLPQVFGAMGGAASDTAASTESAPMIPEEENMAAVNREMGAYDLGVSSLPAAGTRGESLVSEPAAGALEDSALKEGETPPSPENRESISRRIIRNGRLSLSVDSFDETLEKLRSTAEAQGGYVVSQDRYTVDEKERAAGQITVKVPFDRFDEFLNLAKELGKTTDEQVEAQDVTEQYIDLTARLQVYETKLTRLLELLDQSGDLSEVLAVENELAATRAELESLEGQLRYLDNQTSYSTLAVQITEKPLESTEIQVGGFAGLWQEVKESFISGINGLFSGIGSFFVSLAGWLPALILVLLLALILWKAGLKKYWRKQK